jgi:hypothetical protein
MSASSKSFQMGAVARLLFDVGRSFEAFEFEGQRYISRPIDDAMKEARAAFDAEDYDRAERLAKVVACMVRREAPKFAANPRARIERFQGLRA